MKVELQNLTKIFPSRNKKSNEEVIAVNDFTLTIPTVSLLDFWALQAAEKVQPFT